MKKTSKKTSWIWRWKSPWTLSILKKWWSPNSFTKENQPSPLAKKEGRNRKREAQAMMDRIKKYQKLPLWEIQEILADKEKMKELPGEDIMALQYAVKSIKTDKFILDRMDRNVSKAPVEHTGPDWEWIPITFYLPKNNRK